MQMINLETMICNNITIFHNTHSYKLNCWIPNLEILFVNAFTKEYSVNMAQTGGHICPFF